MNSPTTPDIKQKKGMFKSKLCYEDILDGDLISLAVSTLPSSKTLRKQPDYLLSPSPVKKDLFAQLLGTQCKQNALLFSSNLLIQEEYPNNSDEQQCDESQSSISEQLSSEGQPNSQNADFIMKRKRKSTTQMKTLKQELSFNSNWEKNTIAKMAKITGLSESQVYKWFWDQKKKDRAFNEKTNTIKKKTQFQQVNGKMNKTIFSKKSENYSNENRSSEKLNKKLIFN